MAHYLKKLAAGVCLEYADGSVSRGLLGENFRLEFSPEGVIFQVDLSGNLAQRNRGLPCYRDAIIFRTRHHKLRRFHLLDKNLSGALGAVADHVEDVWRLELHAARPFVYAARPLASSSGTGFHVESFGAPPARVAESRASAENCELS